ncbi:MAG: hypothetical protein NTX57_12275, partial [Armatimonadetes bacterium]|nr:hypothetical protein [Armatimonadota bacterium]
TNFLTYYNDNEILKLAENTKNKLENLRNSISSVLEGDNHISGVKNWEKLSEQDKIRNISMMSKIGGADSEIFRQITQNPQMLQGATIKYSLSLDISVGTGLPGDGGSKTAYRIY